MENKTKSINVKDLEQLLKTNKDLYILDVRNPSEVALASLGGFNIPLGQLHDRYSQVPSGKDIYCLCHHGVRSQMAQDFLLQNGYNNVINIEGGIDAWSLEIDSNIPRY